ncbi:MAG: ABC transporter ATP-binding protein [Christensenellaceae bacterium]|nr:ABC transporter ATP-binding protein [Christensenellaceae bacterium]
MLEVKDLYVNYGNLSIIQGVSMRVEKGENVALIGANGAGKTAFVRALSQLNTITGGQILFEGEDVTLWTPDKMVEAGIIQVPEGRKLFPKMTVRENIEMGAYAKRAKAKMAENIDYVYSVFTDLSRMEKQLCGNLSGGQQQMVAIARGIMACPKLLILDEPSIGLSPITTQSMFEVISLIHSSGIAVLITEQNVHDVLRMADRAYVMQQGKIAMSGSAADIAKDEDLRKIYLGM